jgi:hypothetical protein
VPRQVPKWTPTPEEIEAWVTESRAAQGLPPTIEDPRVLERIAAILLRSYDREPAA